MYDESLDFSLYLVYSLLINSKPQECNFSQFFIIIYLKRSFHRFNAKKSDGQLSILWYNRPSPIQNIV